ncbi:endoribonuclease ysh1 [Fusarium oxysporum]|nr:endoribonuclease ysh1 [Fusarium oxysporum]
MAPEDLREYAGLNTTTITCKQRLTLSAAGVDLVKWALEGTFGNIEELPEMRRGKNGQSNGHGDHMITDGEKMKQEDADEEVASLVAAYLVMGCVSVRYRTNGEVELEWEGNMLNDGIADSVMAVLFSVESSPAAVKRSSAKHSHSHELPDVNPHHSASPEERLERLLWFLEAQFGQDNVAPVTIPKLPAVEDTEEKIKKDEADDAMKTEEDGEDTQLQERQQKEIDRLHKIGIPVPGVSIKVDRMNATVWLEDLEVGV